MTAAPELKESFTSTGSKLFWHIEAMNKLRDGRGMPITTHIMPTDVCNAKCAFCSVGERPGDVMPFEWIKGYLDQLVPLGLKSVIISGGGNPILYRDKASGADFNDLVNEIDSRGLEIGLITNGMPMHQYGQVGRYLGDTHPRTSWKTVNPTTLDKLTWCRISMAGLDANHDGQVHVPDFDYSKTSLGFSWIMSDAYEEPSHKHGWVSTPEDVKAMPRPNDGDPRPWPPCPECKSRERAVTTDPQYCPYCKIEFASNGGKVVHATDRLPWIEEQIRAYVERHNPAYVRLLCNCLQPDLIPERHAMLSAMADRINPAIVFSQFKPPRQPLHNCAKIYPHPVLNCDGYVYPCDSVVLNRTADHKFGSAWRVCRWDKIGELYANPIRQVIPNNICPQCVFSDQVDMIGEVTKGADTPMPERPVHENFV